jgi:hypothetical protein
MEMLLENLNVMCGGKTLLNRQFGMMVYMQLVPIMGLEE